MRIAWLGPAGEGGGGPGLGTSLLECVLCEGAVVDYYSTSSREQLPQRLQGYSNLHVIHDQSAWQWGRWYSRTPFLSFLSGIFARTRAYVRLANELIRNNRADRYDVVFQWSFTELFSLGKHLHELPPIVVYPGVHAAGELRWHRRESAYARQSESRFMHYVVRIYLMFRSFYQARQLRKPTLVIGLSRRFNELLCQDYGVDPGRTEVLRHPIRTANDAVDASKSPSAETAPRDPIKLLFVGRISVRKGIEQIIELSKRLDDLHGRVELDVIGNRTQWSNYLAHLSDLNPRIARYRGELNYAEIMDAYRQADVLLVPSMYEPGGIVVGEALSHGMCVVASDEVGSAEPISKDCARIFRAGDVDAMEQSVRELVAELQGDHAPSLQAAARREAQRHFDPAAVGRQLTAILNRVVARNAVVPSVASPENKIAFGEAS